jgi:ATP synthase protein I
MINKEEKKKPIANFNDSYRQVAPYLGLGTQLAATLTILTLAGFYLDKHFETKPLFTLIGAFFGASAGLYNFIKSLLAIDNKKRKK